MIAAFCGYLKEKLLCMSFKYWFAGFSFASLRLGWGQDGDETNDKDIENVKQVKRGRKEAAASKSSNKHDDTGAQKPRAWGVRKAHDVDDAVGME